MRGEEKKGKDNRVKERKGKEMIEELFEEKKGKLSMGAQERKRGEKREDMRREERT